MRILSNFTLMSNNFGYINPQNTTPNRQSYISNFEGYDTVTFTGGKTKTLKTVKDKYISPNRAFKTGKRHIKYSTFSKLDSDTQAIMKNLHNALDTVHDFAEKHTKTNAIGFAKLREAYEPFVVIRNQRGLTFKMGENKTITVLKNRCTPNLVRFTITQDGKPYHYLLDGTDKVVSNLDQKYPRCMPRTFRYMTSEEIKKSGIKAYIEFANKSVEDYKNYLLNAQLGEGIKSTSTKTTSKTTTAKRTRKTPKKHTCPNFDLIKNQYLKNPKNSILKLFNIEKIEELPKHLRLIQSKRNGLLGFSMDLENGSELKVLKRISSTYGSNLRYLSIIEQAPNGTKKVINIDMLNGDILKTGPDDKPLVVKEILRTYTPEELENSTIKSQLEDYANQIFRNNDSAKPTRAIVLADKKAKKEFSLDDFGDFENLEDLNITKQIEEDFLKMQEEYSRKAKNAADIFAIKETKRRGHKLK